MTDRPASWRMPTTKQMQKLAAAVGKSAPERPIGPAEDLPSEYWESILRGVSADDRRSGSDVRTRRLADVSQHVLRVSCRRCARTVEIQRLDAVRLFGPDAVWTNVGQRLLDDTCQNRTGRHEEDGCWPNYDAS